MPDCQAEHHIAAHHHLTQLSDAGLYIESPSNHRRVPNQHCETASKTAPSPWTPTHRRIPSKLPHPNPTRTSHKPTYSFISHAINRRLEQHSTHNLGPTVLAENIDFNSK
ncbi:hypothetical protein COLO4_23738 [Corchorus olitorius]|uniref:Uncharacterized protein n=1 Tax=Corchorus olitorius TaxID=93759 RepID=A0A1R3IEX0_9ROSI|nr:hypothetical protein COLO4_23738 [Corchorus olitorius]